MDILMIKNLRIFPIFEIFYRFTPHFLIAPLYYQEILGSYTLAMAVFSTTLISCSISEIPMGIISDFMGRKRTIIFASFCNFFSFLLFILAGIFEQYSNVLCFSAAIVLGLSQALYSGTLDAFIYESIKASNQLEDYNRLYSRIKGLGAMSSAISALLSGILSYYYSYIICFYLSGFAAVMTMIIGLFYYNIDYSSAYFSYKNLKEHLKNIYLFYKNNTKLRWISLAKIMGDNVSYRIDIIYFKMLIPEYLLGTPRMLKKFCECISYIYASYLIEKFKPIGVLIISNSYMIAIRSLAIGLNNFLSPFIISLVDLLDGTSSTSFSNLLQHEYSDKQRATMESIISMVSTIWTSILLLLIGIVIDYTGVRFALFVLIIYRFIRYFIYYKVLR